MIRNLKRAVQPTELVDRLEAIRENWIPLTEEQALRHAVAASCYSASRGFSPFCTIACFGSLV
jgi:hypothetical protein